MPLFDLTGKKAFVTGASRGIGQVIAVALAGAGADLALVARGAEGLAETAAQVAAHGRKAFVIPADVTRQEEVAAAVAAAIEQLGHVDVVVNNAGGSNFLVPFLDLKLPGWDKLIRLNLDSAMYVCHAVGGHLVERGQGSVINVASVAGLAASPFLSPYGAAKAGLDLADEVARGRMGDARRPGQRAVPGLDRYRSQPEPVAGRGRREGHRGDGADAALGPRRGDGRSRGFPGQRRLVVHDRAGTGHRWRPDRDGLTLADIE